MRAAGIVLGLIVLAAPGPSAQAPSRADTAAVADDSLAVSPAEARRAAEGATLDSLLRAHPDVFAARLEAAEDARPWWRRWWALPLALGVALLAVAGAAVAGYRRLRAELALVRIDDGAAATQAATRADADAARLNADVTARLEEVEQTRRAIEAQIAQMTTLFDRVERAGLFRAAFAQAVAEPPTEATNLPSSPEPSEP